MIMDADLQGLVGDLLAEDSTKYKSIEVFKNVEPKVDTGLMMIEDHQPVTVAKEAGKWEDRLRNHIRDNAQLLINEIWKLPADRVDGVVVAKLPRVSTVLPREKPIPKKKAPSKWEEYRKAKGISTKKKSGKIWDEETQTWKPRYGYKRGKDSTKDWVIPIGDQKDPMRDYYGERMEGKKERVAKNEMQRMRNIQRTARANSDGLAQAAPSAAASVAANKTNVGATAREKSGEEIAHQIARARKATASAGKFTEKVSKSEQGPKNKGIKRKFAPNETSVVGETKSQLDTLDRIKRNKPLIHMDKAIGHLQQSNEANNAENRRPKKGKSSKKGAASAADRKKQRGNKKQRASHSKRAAEGKKKGGGGRGGKRK